MVKVVVKRGSVCFSGQGHRNSDAAPSRPRVATRDGNFALRLASNNDDEHKEEHQHIRFNFILERWTSSAET